MPEAERWITTLISLRDGPARDSGFSSSTISNMLGNGDNLATNTTKSPIEIEQSENLQSNNDNFKHPSANLWKTNRNYCASFWLCICYS